MYLKYLVQVNNFIFFYSIARVENTQQFVQDVAQARDLSHPHLLRVLGVSVAPGEDPIIVTPFMATEDLGSYIREPSKVYRANAGWLSIFQ